MKNTLRKWVSVLAAVSMCLSLAGCGTGNDSVNASTDISVTEADITESVPESITESTVEPETTASEETAYVSEPDEEEAAKTEDDFLEVIRMSFETGLLDPKLVEISRDYIQDDNDVLNANQKYECNYLGQYIYDHTGWVLGIKWEIEKDFTSTGDIREVGREFCHAVFPDVPEENTCCLVVRSDSSWYFDGDNIWKAVIGIDEAKTLKNSLMQTGSVDDIIYAWYYTIAEYYVAAGEFDASSIDLRDGITRMIKDGVFTPLPLEITRDYVVDESGTLSDIHKEVINYLGEFFYQKTGWALGILWLPADTDLKFEEVGVRAYEFCNTKFLRVKKENRACLAVAHKDLYAIYPESNINHAMTDMDKGEKIVDAIYEADTVNDVIHNYYTIMLDYYDYYESTQ